MTPGVDDPVRERPLPAGDHLVEAAELARGQPAPHLLQCGVEPLDVPDAAQGVGAGEGLDDVLRRLRVVRRTSWSLRRYRHPELRRAHRAVQPRIAGDAAQVDRGREARQPLYQVVTRRQGPFRTGSSMRVVVLDLATHDIDLTWWSLAPPHRSVPVRSAPQRPPATRTWSASSPCCQWADRRAPRQLVVAVQGARDGRDRRGSLVADTLHGGPHAVQERFRSSWSGNGRGIPRRRRRRRDPVRDPEAGTAHDRAAQLRRGGPGVTPRGTS